MARDRGKRVAESNAGFVKAAVDSACGPRASNEDAHILICEWSGAPVEAGLFAVLDGHTGRSVAEAAVEKLPGELREELSVATWDIDGRCGAAECAFLAVDRKLQRLLGEKAFVGGSTCVLAMTWKETENSFAVMFANLGDSRALLVGGPNSATPGAIIAETQDHRPGMPAEAARIRAAGGQIWDGGVRDGPMRVDGELSCSRAFGDLRLKANMKLPPEKQKVSLLPEVAEHQCVAGDILILACDGVFDVLSSADVADIVSRVCVGDDDVDNYVAMAGREVVRLSLERNTMDNATCLVAQLQGGPTQPSNKRVR